MWPFSKSEKPVSETLTKTSRSVDAYNLGVIAGQRCAEAWENPYCTPDSTRSWFAYWEAGRCFGRQQLESILMTNVEVRRGEALACNAGLGAARPGKD